MSFGDEFILPENPLAKKETMFAMPIWPIVDQVYKLQKAQVNLDDYMLVVPTEGDFGKFYIVHKKSLK